MRLRSLFEAAGTEVAIIFGRFNPPHKGHRAAWELASNSPVWFVGTNESTVGPKDPLPFDVKVEAMKTVWPEVESHIVAETSWLTLASKVYEQYPDATLLCLTDEDWVTKTIVQYNGKEGAHGFYNFKNITQKPTPRLSSATALRDAVSKGDREAFTQAAGVNADTPVAGKPFFDLVAEYLLPYSNAPVKKPAKKKVAVPVEGIDEDVHEEPIMHRIRVTVSDPSAEANVRTKEMQKTVRVTADDPKDAIKMARDYYTNKGYKVHDHHYISPVDVEENFADGKNPQDKGDSKRHGINTKASVSSLRKTAKQGGRKGQLAHWLANMKAGRAKKEDVEEAKEADYGADYQDKVKRLGQMAKEGPRKTVWDPVKRVYKTVPVNPPKTETIKKVGSQYELVSKKGKNLGKYPTKAGAEKREKQVNYFKHVDEEAAGVGIITKQNSTPDVNKSTPRKNLKAFKLIK